MTAPERPAAKTAAKTATETATKTATKTAPRQLKVREDESPWTTAELREVREELQRDVERLQGEITAAESDLQVLLRDSGDGTGDDQADAGAKTFEREQEITLANNSREMLEQSLRALARIDDGTYGVCESCGNPVGKMRLQAFPRATLCVSCKQLQERR
ncbi:MAG: TraR/DksA family transcriptional regulator [Angustibacter sp.]